MGCKPRAIVVTHQCSCIRLLCTSALVSSLRSRNTPPFLGRARPRARGQAAKTQKVVSPFLINKDFN